MKCRADFEWPCCLKRQVVLAAISAVAFVLCAPGVPLLNTTAPFHAMQAELYGGLAVFALYVAFDTQVRMLLATPTDCVGRLWMLQHLSRRLAM